MDAATIRLEPKTRKGRNRLAELRAAHGTDPRWEVMERHDRVLFSGDSGPWLLVIPQAEPYTAMKFLRWVNAWRDPDFAVHEV